MLNLFYPILAWGAIDALQRPRENLLQFIGRELDRVPLHTAGTGRFFDQGWKVGIRHPQRTQWGHLQRVAQFLHPRDAVVGFCIETSGQYLRDLVVPAQGLALRVPFLEGTHVGQTRGGEDACAGLLPGNNQIGRTAQEGEAKHG